MKNSKAKCGFGSIMDFPGEVSEDRSDSVMNKTFVGSFASSESESFSFNGALLGEVGPPPGLSKEVKRPSVEAERVDPGNRLSSAERESPSLELILANLSFSSMSAGEDAKHQLSQAIQVQLPIIGLSQKLNYSTASVRLGTALKKGPDFSLDFPSPTRKGPRASPGAPKDFRKRNSNFQGEILEMLPLNSRHRENFLRLPKSEINPENKNVWNVPANCETQNRVWWEQKVEKIFLDTNKEGKKVSRSHLKF